MRLQLVEQFSKRQNSIVKDWQNRNMVSLHLYDDASNVIPIQTSLNLHTAFLRSRLAKERGDTACHQELREKTTPAQGLTPASSCQQEEAGADKTGSYNGANWNATKARGLTAPPGLEAAATEHFHTDSNASNDPNGSSHLTDTRSMLSPSDAEHYRSEQFRAQLAATGSNDAQPCQLQ